MAARYSHIAFNDISYARRAPAFQISTEYHFTTVLVLLHLRALPLDTLPKHSPSLCLLLDLSRPNHPLFLWVSRFLSLSLSLSLFTSAKQIAKYPQVVDFSDYVLRIAYHTARVKTNTDKAEWSVNGVCAEVNDGDFDGSLGYIVTLRNENASTEILPGNRFFLFHHRGSRLPIDLTSNVQLSNVQLLSCLQHLPRKL